ncbi:hypothetical protein PoB_003164300 [Plakobranchus ocellatus]|uniref:Uncharacterized protein n=1 Tax=Plakobranchus ocellatus TaxID=259542 RepID=A0AAV4ACZ3_9GAST|nr:hypothetical protein PoB_003164300 [Plakobranchus ocellatus]
MQTSTAKEENSVIMFVPPRRQITASFGILMASEANLKNAVGFQFQHTGDSWSVATLENLRSSSEDALQNGSLCNSGN